jgi:serine/threonine-protein kinase
MGTVGRFQLRELLGNGGFGQVYLAFDPRLDRDVALKLLRQANPGERVMQRFFREARAAGRLDHPNIVAVHDAGRDNEQCWIAYEYIKGPVLTKARAQRKIELASAVRIARDLADALEYAHRRGVFHRDVKPDNVLLDERGRPRLIDFGLARRDEIDSDLTRDGAVLGTPAYMSPEQANGQSHKADERSDIFSLGVLFHELLYGRRPADPKDTVPSGPAERTGSSTDPPPLAPRIPEEVDRICHKAMAHDPGERYPDAQALVNDLDRWLQSPAAPPRRSRLLTGFVMGAVASFALMAGLKFVGSPTEVPPPTGVQPQISPARAVESSPRPPTTEVVDFASGTVVGNRATHIFHSRANCPSLKDLMPENQVVYETEQAAISEEFVQCKTCKNKSTKAEKRP